MRGSLKRLHDGRCASNDMMVSDPKIDGWYAAAINATSVDQIKQIVNAENQYIVQQEFPVKSGSAKCFLPVSAMGRGF